MLAPVSVLDPLPPSLASAQAARAQEAHFTVDELFANLRKRNGDLEARRRGQGEEFLEIQQQRYKVLLQWRELRYAEALFKEQQAHFEDSLQSRWKQDTVTDKPRLKLNIGGQEFEVASATLGNADAGSLLAALASPRPPMDSDPSGAFFFDRDWWQFRLVLQFLREGDACLPAAKAVLKQLYREAAFWRLPSLQDAVRAKFQVCATRGLPDVAPTVADAVVAQKEWEATATRALQASISDSRLLRPAPGIGQLDATASRTWRDPVYGAEFAMSQPYGGAQASMGYGTGSLPFPYAPASTATGTLPVYSGLPPAHPGAAPMYPAPTPAYPTRAPAYSGVPGRAWLA